MSLQERVTKGEEGACIEQQDLPRPRVRSAQALFLREHFWSILAVSIIIFESGLVLWGASIGFEYEIVDTPASGMHAVGRIGEQDRMPETSIWVFITAVCGCWIASSKSPETKPCFKYSYLYESFSVATSEMTHSYIHS